MTDRNPYRPPTHDGPPDAAAPRRRSAAGVTSLVLAGPLMLVGILQIAVWVDHLENASLLSGHPEMARTIASEEAQGRVGQGATLLHLLLGAALIPLGIVQRRRSPGARRATLVTALLAITLSAALALLLLRAGESTGSAWLFLFMPALLTGCAELLLSRSLRASGLPPG